MSILQRELADSIIRSVILVNISRLQTQTMCSIGLRHWMKSGKHQLTLTTRTPLYYVITMLLGHRIILACGARVNEQVSQGIVSFDAKVLIPIMRYALMLVPKGLRPLHYAAYQNYMECVNLLLVRGAEVDAMDEIGYTAMHLCAERGYLDMMLLLLQHGARIRFSDIKREAAVRITSEITTAS